MQDGALAIRLLTCECGKTFQGVARRKKCDECRAERRSAHTRKKNAKRQYRGAGRIYLDTGELITIAALGDRDSWTCWLCNEFVNRALGNRDPWMPSFDHVLPISRGGLDSWDNLRLAHLTCNIKRGNRVS
jgi:5-methylcytosine-specific restriction endonuclease McrA